MMSGCARHERPNLGQPGLAAKQLMADSGHQAKAALGAFLSVAEPGAWLAWTAAPRLFTPLIGAKAL
jgi:hypothetical protein